MFRLSLIVTSLSVMAYCKEASFCTTPDSIMMEFFTTAPSSILTFLNNMLFSTVPLIIQPSAIREF